MNHRRLAVLLQYYSLLLMLAAGMSGCRGGGGLDGRGLIDAALPAVPGSSSRATNAVFEMPFTLFGSETFATSAGARPDGSALELVAAEGEVAYAVYCVNLLESSLTGLLLQSSPVAEAEYWLGISDAATGSWTISGPYSEDMLIVDFPLQHRASDGSFSFMVAVADGNSLLLESTLLSGESGLMNIGYSEHMRPLVFSLVCMNCHNTDNEGAERFGAPGFVNFNTYDLAIENAEVANLLVQAEGMPPRLPPLIRPWQRQMLEEWIAQGAPEGSAVSSLTGPAASSLSRAARQGGPDLSEILPPLPDRFASAHSGGLARPLVIAGDDTLLRSDDSAPAADFALQLQPDSGESAFALYSVSPLGGTVPSISIEASPTNGGTYFVATADYASGEWLTHGPFTAAAEVSLAESEPSFQGNIVFAVVSTGAALTIVDSSLAVERSSDDLTYNSQLGPLLFQSVCAECHVTGVQPAGRRGAPEDVNFEDFAVTEPHIDAALERVQAGEMPPQIPGEFLYPWQRELFQRWADNGFAP